MNAASSRFKADLGATKIISQIKSSGGGLTGFGNTSTYLNDGILEYSTDDQNWAVINPSLGSISDSALTLFAIGAIATRYSSNT